MTYKINVQHEDGIFISTFGPDTLRGEEFDQYLRDVIDLNMAFDRRGLKKVYHILVFESAKLDFEGMMRALTAIRQNKDMIDLRKRLQSLSMMVTNSPAMAQFIDTMLSNTTQSGRRMSVFPTVEAALAFIRFEQSQPLDTPPPTETPSSPNADKLPDP
jgi:hypothetical protein